MSNRLFRLASFSVALAALTACQAPALTENTGVFGAQLLATSPLPDPVITVLNSGIPDRRRVVIRTATEWAALWNEVTANVSPAPPVPEIDFGSEMLLVASMGTQRSGGHTIGIDSVYLAGGGIIHAVVRETSPADSCVVTAALTAPVTAVRMARSSVPVEFRTRSTVHSCE